MEASEDIKRELLFTLHPYTSSLCGVNTDYQRICNDRVFLRQLRNKWLFPDQNIPNDYPDLSYSQIATYGLFYYPIPESIGKFNPTSLYYRASIVYSEEGSRPFFEHAINYNFQLGDMGYDGIKAMLLIADHFGHRILLKETYNRFILALRPNDPVEQQRKIICIICALLMEDKKKFRLAYNIYLAGRTDEEDNLALDSIDYVRNIYIPGYDIVSLANFINNALVWMGEIDPNEANTGAMNSFQIGLGRQKTVEYSAFNIIGYQLSLCISDEDLLKFVSHPGPIPEDENIIINALADYWNAKSLKDLETIEVLAYRPDLLEELDLFSIPYINYIQADQYYYYLMYSEFISNDKPSIYGKNHLNVSGYNPDLVTLAKRRNMMPDYYSSY